MLIGRSIPSRGLTAAVCLRWPFAVGVDVLRMNTELGYCHSVAVVLGFIEVTISVFR